MFLTPGLADLHAETDPETAAERDASQRGAIELTLIETGPLGPWPEGRPEDFDLALRELHEKAGDALFVLTEDDLTTYRGCPIALTFRLNAKAGERLRSLVPPQGANPDRDLERWLSDKAFLLTLNGKEILGGIAYIRYGAALFPYPMLKLNNLDPLELSVWISPEDRERRGRIDLKIPLADHGVQIEDCGSP